MLPHRFRPAALCLVFASTAAFACAECEQDDVPDAGPRVPVQTLALEISGRGFFPRELEVKAGAQLRLRITRTSEKACSGGFVVEGYTVPIVLPVHQALDVEVTVPSKGRVRLSCGKGSPSGTLVVR